MTDLADMRRDLERLIRAEDQAAAAAIGRRDWYRQALEVVSGMLKSGPPADQSKPGPKPRTAELEQLRADLIAAIKEHGPHSAGALAVVVNSHKTIVKKELARMSAAGLVRSEGNRRAQRWHLGTTPANP